MADSSFRINRGITLNPQASAPTAPTNGDIYYDSSLGTFVFYDNGQWINLASRIDVASAGTLTSTQFTSTVVQSSLVRLTGATSGTIHGLTASTDGKTVVLYNNTNQLITIAHQSGTEATAANRIVTHTAASIVVPSGMVCTFVYDSNQSRWVFAAPAIDGLDKLFEDRNALLTQGGLITFTGTALQFTEALALEINQREAGGAPIVISLGSSDRALSATGRMLYAVIDRVAGTAVVTADATSLPAAVPVNQEVFLIAKRVDAADGTKRVYFRQGTALDEGQTVRLGSSINGTAIAAIQDFASAGFQGFVDESTRLSAVNATPSTGQFRSEIRGRASIPDLANDMRARFGIDRIPAQQIIEVPNECGVNGERVFKILNDDREVIRFIGNWMAPTSYSSGPVIVNSGAWSSPTDQIEVVFYGTGLNLLRRNGIGATSTDISVDGGATSTLAIIPSSDSAVSGARNYSPNLIVPIVSGLSLGLHTVVLKGKVGNTDNLMVQGFEILNESTTIKVQPGTSYVAGKKLISSTQQSLDYSSTFESIQRDGASQVSTSTRGGRVLVYQKSDGTIAKSIVEADSTQKNLTSADHSNEEMIRKHSFREFGVGRSDDFSTLVGSTSNRWHTLDDGTTALFGYKVFVNSNDDSTTTTNAFTDIFHCFTFVGTGCDIIRSDSANGTVNQHELIVDGTSVGNLNSTASTTRRVEKLVSGLPYGTHTVKISRTVSAGTNLGIVAFLVYGPKKPSLPSGAVELADYNLMATFARNTLTGNASDARRSGVVSTGVLRKTWYREITFIDGTGGTTSWSLGPPNPVYDTNGICANTDRAGAYLEYTFFGTGFEFRGRTETDGATNVLVQLNGTNLTLANFPTITSQVTGTGTSFNTSTAIFNQRNASSQPYSSFTISGLPLGVYKLRMTNQTASQLFRFDSLDIITPVHSHKSNLYGDLQNTLAVGSCAISDSRKISAIKEVLPGTKAWVQAIGVTSGPTTNSTSYVPAPEMSLTLRTTGGSVQLTCAFNAGNNTLGSGTILAFFVNGVQVSPDFQSDTSRAGDGYILNLAQTIALPAGVHKIDVYWKVTGGIATAGGTRRVFTAREL